MIHHSGFVKRYIRRLTLSGIALGFLFLPGPTEKSGAARAGHPAMLPALAAPQAAGMVFEQVPTDGLVVMEVENFRTNTPQGVNTWTFVTAPAGFQGSGAMQAQPDGVGFNNTGYDTMSPRLNFQVAFISTGTHYVWVRGISIAGLSGSSDSIHSGLDGGVIATADRLNSFTDTGYTWHNNTMDAGAACTFDVPTVGVHTVNLWMREDGFTADRLLLTTTANYMTNGNTAAGPAESNQIPDPSPAAPTGLTATPGPTSITLTWGAVTGATSYNILCGTTMGGPYTTIATGVTATSYTNTGIFPPTTYYYVVQSVNGFGTSANSNEASAVPLPPPPATVSEGEEGCGCGSIASAFPSGILWIAVALALGMMLLTRRS